ncbi:hypothetical protein SRHO_G00018740 [Serrasalmus rhombeus]
MVLRKGKVEDKFWFYIAGTAIPMITEKPVKSLAKVFDSSLKDSTSIQSTCAELDGWLKSVDKSCVPGKFKAWVYQHGVLPRILRPLLVYAIPISTVETLERKVSNHLRRRLGLPKSLSSIALYGHNNKLQLPFKSLEEEFKVTRAREVVQYRDSSDPKVAKVAWWEWSQEAKLAAAVQHLEKDDTGDQVLKTIAEAIKTGLVWAKQFCPSKKTIAFVRAREQAAPVKRSPAGILTTARDWQLLVDLKLQLKFPSHIAVTTLRPDIVLVSESTKQAMLLELTVPREDRLEEAFERKLSKYTGLVSHSQQAGWRVKCLPVEVGCRGFADCSLARALSSLGIVGERKRRAIYNTTEAAERASRWLWLERGEPWSRGS